MLHCNDIDGLMVDWLYGELDEARSAEVAGHVDSCSRCQAEQSAFARTREIFSVLPEYEPSEDLTAMLLREAELSAKPSEAAAAVEIPVEKPGFGEWLAQLFRPLMHPAAAAVATLVVVIGVAGALYVKSGDEQFAGDDKVAVKSEPAAEARATAALSDSTKEATETDSADPTPAPAQFGEATGKLDDQSFRRADILVQDVKPAPAKAPADKGKRSYKKKENKKAIAIAGVEEDADGDGLAFEGESAPGKDALAYRGQKSSWEANKEAEIAVAFKNENCLKTAAIANDIRDRNPKYYQANTAELDAVKKCRHYVAKERKRRVARDSQRAASKRAKSKSKKSGDAKSGGKVDTAKAAPADEFADDTPAAEGL